ncbi:MAG: HipA N-terminal domain-containing protein [Clostridia bacterium]|nr:HipA N-terminal domain-containing protein [Clostridia bacterium]
MSQNNKYLYLIWKDPQTRQNFTIGKLGYGSKYTFEYSRDVGKAEKNGWSKFEVFPDEKNYESEVLFPVFASRLPDKKRRDIDKILEKYNLSEFNEFELLKKSEGRLPIDTYSFIDPIFLEDDTIQRDFHIMGVRYHTPCKGNDCLLLPEVTVGDKLILEKEPENQFDVNAIKVLTQSGELLGYVPRYYNEAILERLNKNMTYTCTIIDLNFKDCSECIKVRLNMPEE